MINELLFRRRMLTTPLFPAAVVRLQTLENRTAPATLAQGQAYALTYAANLQLTSGPLSGAYRAHVNLGILPGTGGEGQPPAVYAYEVDPWLSTETARFILQSKRPISEVLPQAINAAQAFLNTRGPEGEPPLIRWVNASGNVLGTSNTDAFDSAYASFLRLTRAIYQAAPNDSSVQSFLNTNQAAIFNVAYQLALQNDADDGLFWTFPTSNTTYRMKLLAGNCEAVAGMYAAQFLATHYYQDTTAANYYGSFAINGQQAILANFYKPSTIGQWYISKDHNGVQGSLTTTPNWNQFDMFLTYVINCDIVPSTSARANSIITFLMHRHPNALYQRPVSPNDNAVTYTPEFGIAYAKVRRVLPARSYAQAVIRAEFPSAVAKPDGYFTIRNVGALIALIGMLPQEPF